MFPLYITAASVAFLHSLANPSHYMPFVALGKARGWGIWRTVSAAALCGLGHVLGFAAVAAVGFALGRGLDLFRAFAEHGEFYAGLAFLLFGLGYFAYGLWAGLSGAGSCGGDGRLSCGGERVGVGRSKSFWILFFIFALGPCDAVLPVILYPALEGDIWALAVAGAVFYSVTVLTMSLATAALYKGITLANFGGGFAHRWAHAISGLVIAAAAAFLLAGHAH